MSLSLISHLLQSYGYFRGVRVYSPLRGLGIPLPGESTLIAAAVYYAGSTHRLNIGVIFLAAAHGGDLRVDKRRVLARPVRRASGWRARYGALRPASTPAKAKGRPVPVRAARRDGGVSSGAFVAVLRTYAAFLAGLKHDVLAPLHRLQRRRGAWLGPLFLRVRRLRSWHGQRRGWARSSPSPASGLPLC